MAASDIYDLTREALYLALLLTLPIIGAAMAAALLTAILQSLMKTSDPMLAVVPRIIAGVAALILISPWLGEQIALFSVRIWSLIQAVRV